MDNASDIHVCNDNQRSSFQKTSDATSKDELFAGKTSYPIEAFGTATVPVQTLDGMRTIILTNVALAPRFITNLVSLYLLNAKGVYWASENPQVLTKNRTTFYMLD